MSDDLLPPNASALERQMALQTTKITALPVQFAVLHDVEQCPAPFLPWLAWSSRIDYWKSEWPDHQKREVIANARIFNRQRGTRRAILQLLDQLLPELDPQLIAWHEQQPHGTPYTFIVSVPATVLELSDLQSIQSAVDSTKSVRDAYAIAASVRTRSTTHSAGAASFGLRATLQST